MALVGLEVWQFMSVTVLSCAARKGMCLDAILAQRRTEQLEAHEFPHDAGLPCALLRLGRFLGGDAAGRE